MPFRLRNGPQQADLRRPGTRLLGSRRFRPAVRRQRGRQFSAAGHKRAQGPRRGGRGDRHRSKLAPGRVDSPGTASRAAPKAIPAGFPKTRMETLVCPSCAIPWHSPPRRDRKAVAGALECICRARPRSRPSGAGAFAEGTGRAYRRRACILKANLERGHPGLCLARWRPLQDDPSIHNAVAAVHAKLRRAGQDRCHFPTAEAVLKLLFWVSIPALRRADATGSG